MDFLTEKDIDKANVVDATSTVVGSILGTSTTTSYIESLAGTAAGARTGFASIITGLLFVIAIFFAPLLSIITPAVTASALVIVGVMMTKSLGKIEWEHLPVAIGAFITIIFMILTYSISNGIGFGFIAYVIAMVASKKGKQVSPILYGVGIAFVIYLILGFLV